MHSHADEQPLFWREELLPARFYEIIERSRSIRVEAPIARTIK